MDFPFFLIVVLALCSFAVGVYVSRLLPNSIEDGDWGWKEVSFVGSTESVRSLVGGDCTTSTNYQESNPFFSRHSLLQYYHPVAAADSFQRPPLIHLPGVLFYFSASTSQFIPQFQSIFENVFSNYIIATDNKASLLSHPLSRTVFIVSSIHSPDDLNNGTGRIRPGIILQINHEPHSNLGFQKDFDIIYDDLIDPARRPLYNRDRGVKMLPIIWYVPFYVTSFAERFQNTWNDLLKAKRPPNIPSEIFLNDPQILQRLSLKTKFAVYMVSHCTDERNAFFELLSRYKRVDALGSCSHNVDRSTSRDLRTSNMTYLDDAVQVFEAYKFSVCMENSLTMGYITEKIVNAMLAGSIPIYWGDPLVGVRHFNPKSFVNVNSFASFDDAIEYVKFLDGNDTSYRLMLAEPWFLDNKFNNFIPVPANPFNEVYVQWR